MPRRRSRRVRKKKGSLPLSPKQLLIFAGVALAVGAMALVANPDQLKTAALPSGYEAAPQCPESVASGQYVTWLEATGTGWVSEGVSAAQAKKMAEADARAQVLAKLEPDYFAEHICDKAMTKSESLDINKEMYAVGEKSLTCGSECDLVEREDKDGNKKSSLSCEFLNGEQRLYVYNGKTQDFYQSKCNFYNGHPITGEAREGKGDETIGYEVTARCLGSTYKNVSGTYYDRDMSGTEPYKCQCGFQCVPREKPTRTPTEPKETISPKLPPEEDELGETVPPTFTPSTFTFTPSKPKETSPPSVTQPPVTQAPATSGGWSADADDCKPEGEKFNNTVEARWSNNVALYLYSTERIIENGREALASLIVDELAKTKQSADLDCTRQYGCVSSGEVECSWIDSDENEINVTVDDLYFSRNDRLGEVTLSATHLKASDREGNKLDRSGDRLRSKCVLNCVPGEEEEVVRTRSTRGISLVLLLQSVLDGFRTLASPITSLFFDRINPEELVATPTATPVLPLASPVTSTTPSEIDLIEPSPEPLPTGGGTSPQPYAFSPVPTYSPQPIEPSGCSKDTALCKGLNFFLRMMR